MDRIEKWSADHPTLFFVLFTFFLLMVGGMMYWWSP